jgi:hypothetical protein
VRILHINYRSLFKQGKIEGNVPDGQIASVLQPEEQKPDASRNVATDISEIEMKWKNALAELRAELALGTPAIGLEGNLDLVDEDADVLIQKIREEVEFLVKPPDDLGI